MAMSQGGTEDKMLWGDSASPLCVRILLQYLPAGKNILSDLELPAHAVLTQGTCTSLGCSVPAGTLLFWGAPSGSGRAAFKHGNCEHHGTKQANRFACIYKVSSSGWIKNVLLSIINAGAPRFPDQGKSWETPPQTTLHRLVKLCIEVPGMVP